MTTAEGTGSAVGAVSALMEERRRYETWIAALDQKRASTPDHVFTRVHADYQDRLDAVVEKLSTHAEGLREEIETLTGRLVGVREEQQAATDERSEAELRAHVGEVSTEEWERLASVSDQRLGELRTRCADIEQELARTRQLLEDTQRRTPVSAPASQPPEPMAAEVQASSEQLEIADTAEAAAHVPAAAEAIAPPLPEPAPAPVEASPVVQPAAAVPVAPAPSSAAPKAAAPLAKPQSSGGFDELSFLRSVVETPAGAVDAPRPHDEPDEATKLDTFALHAREDAVQRLTGEQPLIMRSGGEDLSPQHQTTYQRTPGSALDRVKDPAIEGSKTLKCGECGAANYPTEWYCERCGAELASL
jgi:hypothetical protein